MKTSTGNHYARGRVIGALDTVATTSSGGEHEAAVVIDRHDGHYLLSIADTPGHWRVKSLAGIGDNLAIDFGSGWALTNARALLAEAEAIVAAHKAPRKICVKCDAPIATPTLAPSEPERCEDCGDEG